MNGITEYNSLVNSSGISIVGINLGIVTTMKHIKQGPGECKLATIAMLAGVSLDEVRKIACEAAMLHKWETCNSDNFWAGIDALKLLFDGQAFKVLLRPELTGILWDNDLNSFGTTKKYFPGDPLPLTGKGEMFIYYVNGARHSIAYENGIIFDPDQTKELPFTEWLVGEGPANIEFFIL